MSASSSTAYLKLVQEITAHLPIDAALDGAQIRLTLKPGLKWKGSALTFSPFASAYQKVEGCELTPNELRIRADIKGTHFKKFHDTLIETLHLIAGDNPQALSIWGRASRVIPKGFNEATPSTSKNELDALYKDDFIVKEKKALILDLDQCVGPYLVGVAPENACIIDGASQIASLPLGFNDPEKNTMPLRSEIFDPSLDLESWDITRAFKHFLKRESEMPYVNFVNSGAEAVECCLRACHAQYPDRKKILAFDGSFHGRSVLAIHTTHSPAKRLPFEMYPGMVEFLPFPEDKNPMEPKAEPGDWLKLWSKPESSDFLQKIERFLISNDPLLQNEVLVLLRIRAELLKERPLCVLAEPLQCEGGDRFGTPRFFRAMRVLTRALDTPLVFDEVQSGYGLGGKFFWHQLFDLTTPTGERDTPDAVAMAKKAQVGVCLTRSKQEIKTETSPASIYRGYIHAREVKDFDPSPLTLKTRHYLQSMQAALGKEIFIAPRNLGMTFAFDLPSAKVLNSLIKWRFENGILFYPAGDQTARFRLMASCTDQELAQIFWSIFGCFESASKEGVIGKVPTREEWIAKHPEDLKTHLNEIQKKGPTLDKATPWKPEWIPSSASDLKKLSASDWNACFRAIMKETPQTMRSEISRSLTLSQLNAMNAEQLWDFYQKTPGCTLLDLMWLGSRRFSQRVESWGLAEIKTNSPKLQALQDAVYEPARRTPVSELVENAADKRSNLFVALDASGNLVGMTATAPLSNYSSYKLVNTDPEAKNPKALYSVDLTVATSEQGKGLGLRLKVEQYMEAIRQDADVIRSRNRHPEAQAMNVLNRQLGSVVIDKSEKDYEGNGKALYQSIRISKSKGPGFKHPYLPALENKSTLSNFVSRSYVGNLLLLKEYLPEGYRHLFLSSGRSETVDKMVKLLRDKKPGADRCMSLKGDYFGETTAAARSLGGIAGTPYFSNWPILDASDSIDAIAKQMDKHDASKILGFFVDPISEKSGKKKSPEFLKALIDLCHSKQIPVIFHETGSAFGKYDPKRLFVSGGELKPDGFIFYPGHQLGLVCVTKKYYLDKALMMISTWDGDEFSLHMLKERLLAHATS